MELGLRGKTALVTGGSQGIGAGIALELAREGVDVVVCARRTGPLHDIKAQIEALKVRCMTVECDVTRNDDIQHVMDRVIGEWKRIDILVNNVGGAVAEKTTVEDSDERWAHCYDINLWPTIRFTRRAVAQMKRQGAGTIINVSSIGGHSASWGGVSPYSSAKAAILMLTKSWSSDFADYGIRVNAICPGYIRSPLWDELADKFIAQHGNTREEVYLHFAKSLPRRRLGTPAEVGYLAAFLSSESMAGFITGACLDIDGGATRRI